MVEGERGKRKRELKKERKFERNERGMKGMWNREKKEIKRGREKSLVCVLTHFRCVPRQSSHTLSTHYNRPGRTVITIVHTQKAC